MSEVKTSRVYRLRWWTLVTIAISILVIVLDATVMNVALPTIQKELNASSSDLLWMVNAYTMIFGALMLTTGSLADRLGRAKVLQAGIIVFGLSSIGAFFSGSANQLIIWRFLMGAGAAMILPTTLAIITNVFPENERGRAIGVWAGLNAIGIALGPIIGGALVQNYRWNSIFLINIPVAVVALLMGWFFIPDSKDSNPRKLDIVGNVMALAGLAALIYGLINGGSKGWTDPTVLGTLAGSVILLTVFVLWERHVSQPLLELGFFKNPRFTAGILILTILGLALNGFSYIATFYMQFVKAYSALGTGLRYIPLAVGLLFGAVGSDRVVKILGAKWVMAIGFTGMAVSLLALASLSIGTSFTVFGIELFFLGAFLGIIMAPVTDIIMGSLPKEKAGIGSAMNTVFRTVSGAIGVAILGSILNSIYTSKFLSAMASIKGLPASLGQAGSNSVGAAVGIAASGKLPPTIAAALAQAGRDSFMDGWHIIGIIIAIIAVVGIVVTITLIPHRHSPPVEEVVGEHTTRHVGLR